MNKERNTKQKNIETSRGKRHPEWKAWNGETKMHMGTEEKSTSREKHEEQAETQKHTYNKTHPQTLRGTESELCRDVRCVKIDSQADRHRETQRGNIGVQKQ